MNIKSTYLLLLITILCSCKNDDDKLNLKFEVSGIEEEETLFYNNEGLLNTKPWEEGREHLSFLSDINLGIKNIEIESESVAYINGTERYNIKQQENNVVLIRESLIRMQSVQQHQALLSNEETGNPNLFFIQNDCLIDSIVLVGSLTNFHIEYFTYELKYNDEQASTLNENGELETKDILLIGDKYKTFDEDYLKFLDDNDTIAIINKVIEFK